MEGPSLRVPTNEAPTFWNKDAAVGASIGAYFFQPFGLVLGTLVGGFIGKRRMEKEREQGKVVSPPSFWNKDIIIGFAIGGALGGIAAVGILVAAGIPLVVGEMVAVSGGLLAAAIGAITTGPIIGAIIGGNHGKKTRAKEYAQAQAYVAQHGEFNPYKAQQIATAPATVQPQPSQTVTSDEIRRLEEKLNKPHHSFTQQLENQPGVPRQL